MQKSLRLKTFINNYTRLIISGLILIIVFLFSWWSNPSLIPTINSDDSPGYILVAEDFTHPVTEIRPFFYSLIIRICMNISEYNWIILLSVFQSLLHSVISVLIFHLYLKYNFKIFLSFIILWKKRLFTLLISSSSMLLYASLAIVLLAPHAGEFPRYRVWVEYIMWFCALMPIGFIIQNLYEKLNNKLI